MCITMKTKRNTKLEPETLDSSEIKNYITKLKIGNRKDKSEQKSKIIKKKQRKNAKKPQIQDDQISSTSDCKTAVVADSGVKDTVKMNSLYQYKLRNYLLIKPGTHVLNEIDYNEVGQENKYTKEIVDLAFQLSENEVDIYKKQRKRTQRSDMGWMKTVMSSGTLGDKVATLTLQIQDSPLHNLSNLDALINMAKKKGRRENSQAIEALQELFTANILPSGRELISINQRPLERLAVLSSGSKELFDRTLLLWYLESQLKSKYLSFIKAVEVLTFDTVAASKKSAISIVFNLLYSRPEQEQVLIAILVNKMGDREHKVAAKAAYLLAKLVSHGSRPDLKMPVIQETENLLYRPNVSERAQYYAVCFLGQIIFSRKDVDLSNKLITIYLSFFKVYVQKGEVERKMMGALLSGVNRAYPFARVKREKIDALINDMYRLVHTINFNTSVQSLLLLYQVHDTNDTKADRFYSAIYKKLLDSGLKNSNKQNLFLNLLFKAMMTDPELGRVKAFMKRLMQISSHLYAPFVCSSLILLSEVLQRRPQVVLDKVVRYVSSAASSSESSRAVYGADDDDDGLEHFADAHSPESDSEDCPELSSLPQRQDVDQNPTSWDHRHIKSASSNKVLSETYDPLHRNPRYCHASMDSVWELCLIKCHYHPSVALFASSLLQNERISYDGDPLKDFTLIRFLDRYAFKNPKRVTSEGGSGAIMRRRDYKPQGLRGVAVESSTYLETTEADIPAEERFLHRYLKRVSNKKRTKSKKPRDDSDNESISDDEFDRFLETKEMKNALELDVARDMKKASKKPSKADSDEDNGSFDDDSDEDVDFDKDEIKQLMGEDDDDVAVDFSDNELEGPSSTSKYRGKRKNATELLSGPGSKKKKSLDGLFASADEFSSILERDSSSKLDTIGSSAINTEGAGVKQMKWEAKQQVKFNKQKRRQKPLQKIKKKIVDNKKKKKF